MNFEALKRKRLGVQLGVAFGVAALVVAIAFGIAARKVGEPSDSFRESVAVNVEILIDGMIQELGNPPTQESVERVAARRKLGVRLERADGSHLSSDPEIPATRSMKAWSPQGFSWIRFARSRERAFAWVERGGNRYVFALHRHSIPFLRWQWWVGFVLLAVAGVVFAFLRVAQLLHPVNRRLQSLLEAKQQLLRDVSHELRSPLARIRVALELLPESPPRRSVEEDVRELDRLVERLLESERLQDPEYRPKQERIDLVEMLEGLRRRYSKEGPGMEWEGGVLPVSRPAVKGDSELLMLLFRNLMENASKYAAAAPHATELCIRVLKAQGRVRITLRDHGPGVAAADREKIFRPFFRGDSARSRSIGGVQGYGLGLDLVRRIALSHGGQVGVEALPEGPGALFWVELPLE
jgi:signal transduction histidine kinase